MPRKKIIPDYGAIIREHEKEILEIDAMPAGGPRNIKGTEFQVRRWRQMNFILSVWERLFPKHPEPEYRELQDYMGVFDSDSLLEAMQYLVQAATRQHTGGRKFNQQKDERGNGFITNCVTKTGRTRRKVVSPLGYAKDRTKDAFGKRPPKVWKTVQPEAKIPEVDAIPY